MNLVVPQNVVKMVLGQQEITKMTTEVNEVVQLKADIYDLNKELRQFQAALVAIGDILGVSKEDMTLDAITTAAKAMVTAAAAANPKEDA